jgi:hypothetical protein
MERGSECAKNDNEKFLSPSPLGFKDVTSHTVEYQKKPYIIGKGLKVGKSWKAPLLSG